MNKYQAEQVLGLTFAYSIKDVKKARRDLALKYHPDLHSDKNRRSYTEKLQIINDAHDLLIKLFKSDCNIKIEPDKADEVRDDGTPSYEYKNCLEYEYIYQVACELMVNPKRIEDLEYSAHLFSQIINYKDSKSLYKYCLILINKYYYEIEREKARKINDDQNVNEYEDYMRNKRERRKQKAEEEAKKKQDDKKEQIRQERLRQEKERERREEETRSGVKMFNEKMRLIKERINRNVPFDWEITLVSSLLILLFISIFLIFSNFDYILWKVNITGEIIRFDWKGNNIEPADFDTLYAAVGANLYEFIKDWCVILAIPPFLIIFIFKYFITKIRKKFFGYSLDPMFLTRFNKALLMAVFCPIIFLTLVPFQDSLFEYLKINIFFNMQNEDLAFELYWAFKIILVVAAHVTTFNISRKVFSIGDYHFRGDDYSRFWRYISRSPKNEFLLCLFASCIVTFVFMLPFIL